MPIPFIMPMNLGGANLIFYDFVGVRDGGEFKRKIEELRPYFNRIPIHHMRAIAGAKIFVVPNNPRRASPGGAYFRPQGVHRWSGQSALTNVEDEWLGPLRDSEVPRECAPKHALGLLSVCEDRFAAGINVYRYTFLHELAHMIDFAMGFTKNAPLYGLSTTSLRGVRYGRFNSNGTYVLNPSVGENFAEAYSRWIVNSNQICRGPSVSNGRFVPTTIPEEERANPSLCNARLRQLLERL